jgi:hypothetical protein
MLMANEVYRGVVRGGMVLLLEPETPLTEGTEVLVTPLTGGPGSSAAVLDAMEAAPQVPAAWVDELEKLIDQGRRSPMRQNPFADEPRRHESP